MNLDCREKTFLSVKSKLNYKLINLYKEFFLAAVFIKSQR